MPSKITKPFRRDAAKRRRAARRAAVVEANVTKCLEDDELSSDSRAQGELLLKRAKYVENLGRKNCKKLETDSRRYVKAVDRAAALRASEANVRDLEAREADHDFKFESGDAMALALKTLGATESQHVTDDQPYRGMVREPSRASSHLCVDWKKLTEATEARIEKIQKSEADGAYTAEQAKEFVSAINFRLKKMVVPGQHDEVEPTAKAKSDSVRAHARALSQAEVNIPPASDFPSPYFEGKWDDFKDTAKPFSNL
ncbi:unnamed protein product [Clonostachys rosea]|uniref:Uncharacterized protein n=1 Tax=Bionectria ochroleuca TaxID=29856 RepID=A0ABY6U0U0_BIOOC|nr:unnamed protein product [Clonostachys rosea]